MRIGRPSFLFLACVSLSVLATSFSSAESFAADAPFLLWETSFDSYPEMGGNGYDVMNDVVTTEDGGAVAAGYAIPPGSHAPGGKPQQGFLVRLDAFGAEMWRTYLGEPADEDYEVRWIRRTADGGVVAACVSFTPHPVGGGGGIYYHTSFVAKLDGDGNEQWRYRFDRLLLDEIGDLDLLLDGSVVVAGRVWGPGGGTSAAVAKISPAGDLLWLRKEPPVHIGRPGKVAAIPAGGFYATYESGIAQTLSRYAPDGARIWTSRIEGLDGAEVFYEKDIHGVSVTADGGCVVIGATRTYNHPNYGPYRPFLVAFDASGRQTFTLVVPTDSVWVHAVERLPDGGLVAAEGVRGSNTEIVFIRYDRAGKELWRSDFGLPDAERYISAIRVSAGGGVLAAGSIGSRTLLYDPLDGCVLMTEGMSAPGVVVDIDVRPGSEQNPVNLRAPGLLPVALLSSADFDATMVDPATITLEGAPVDRIGKGRFHAVRKDVDGDGRFDLLLFFAIPSLDLPPDAEQVTLTGILTGGGTFFGSDRIRVVGGSSHRER